MYALHWIYTHNLLYNVYLRGLYELAFLEHYLSLKVQVVQQLELVFIPKLHVMCIKLYFSLYLHWNNTSVMYKYFCVPQKFLTEIKRQYSLHLTSKTETGVIHIFIAHSLWQKTKNCVMKMTNTLYGHIFIALALPER